ncbi:MAG: RNA-binding protein [Hyphomicrobiaceae bacterium]|jgi:predicted RNA-binding protein YlxR (DUF448 family)
MGHEAQEVAGAEDSDTAAGPERMCAVTRALLAPSGLIRFVRAPDGQIVPDLTRRLPGRGVWISCSRSAVEAARSSGAFARALRRPVSVPEDLPDLVDRLLVRRATEALSLANKAGLVHAGFAKTEATIGSRQCVALIHASDAADDGSAKLDRLFRAIWGERNEPDGAAIITCLASVELSLAMGRSNVVHAALTNGGAGRHFLNEAARLRRYREATGAPARNPKAGANTEKA